MQEQKGVYSNFHLRIPFFTVQNWSSKKKEP